MGTTKVPKYIQDTCKRMEKLCNEAYTLRAQVEQWCLKNGIDTDFSEWHEHVRDEIGGCDAVLLVDEIAKLLNT